MNNKHREHKWWKTAIGYIIYPSTFKDSNDDGIGDLQGIISKLDYLKDLGIDLIWICPFFKSPMDDNGYDVSDYLRVDPRFGTNDDFDLLIKEAHARGIRLVIDFVLNHTSDEHPWFIEAQNNPQSPKRDYYLTLPPRYIEGKRMPPNNWKGFFSTSTWSYDEISNRYYMHIFSKKMPDVNWSNPDLRQEYYRIAKHYLDKGVDGFRLDALAHLSRDMSFKNSDVGLDENGLAFDMSKYSNRPELFDYMREFDNLVFSKYDCVTIGEVGGGISPEQSLDLSGYENGSISMVFNFDTAWENGAYDSVDKKDEELSTDVIKLKNNFYRWYKTCNSKAWMPLYWDNHDHPRVLSQYGSVKFRKESAKMLITTLLFMYGTPFIYYGDEIGMSNVDYTNIEDFNDVSVRNYVEENKNRYDSETLLRFLRRTSRINARTPMQWSDEAYAGFSRVAPSQKVNGNYRQVNVAKNVLDEDSILRYYQKAIALRKEESISESVLFGAFSLISQDHEDVFAYRHDGNKKIVLIANFRAKTIPFQFNSTIKNTLLHNYSDISESDGALNLRPFECYLFEVL
ncbi:MAG: alpha-glucosidase [Candidatus Izemoplasmatales bacterium]|nr:alpha-glucosidase [Candidatus Izemoplasmatales bacterium]